MLLKLYFRQYYISRKMDFQRYVCGLWTRIQIRFFSRVRIRIWIRIRVTQKDRIRQDPDLQHLCIPVDSYLSMYLSTVSLLQGSGFCFDQQFSGKKWNRRAKPNIHPGSCFTVWIEKKRNKSENVSYYMLINFYNTKYWRSKLFGILQTKMHFFLKTY